MVYCGKPSMSCRQCRNRNIKCDKKKDSCGQCLRAQLKCPGYHNPLNLIFRDQTSTIISKIKQPIPIPITKPVSLIPQFILEPLEDRAKILFISRNVLGKSPILVYLKAYPRSKNVPKMQFFEASIRAVSMAYLANEVHDPEIHHSARKRYSTALRLTRESLPDPVVAASDLMLIATLLLHLFEMLSVLSDESSQTQRRHSRHLDGALALAKFRGGGDFTLPFSKAVFMHMSTTIIYDSVTRNVSLPPSFLSLHSQVASVSHAHDFEWQISSLLLRAAEVEAVRRGGTMMEAEARERFRELREEKEDVVRSMGIGMPSVGRPVEENVRNEVRVQKDLRLIDLLVKETSVEV